MVSANPTGPITVASARNGAIGDSLARLLELGGDEVEREYYYNDAGAQMDKFRASVEAVRAVGRSRPRTATRATTSRELAKLEGDPVPPMLERIEQSLERFRIHFDSWARQSELGRAARRSTCLGSTPTRRTAPSGPARRRTATRRIA